MVADADVGSVTATGRLDDMAVEPAVAALVVRCADDGVTAAAADADMAGGAGDDITRREAGGTLLVGREVDDDLADVGAGGLVGGAAAEREPEEEVGVCILNFFLKAKKDEFQRVREGGRGEGEGA